MWLDVVLTLPILWGLYNGYQKGLISQVLGIISLAIGIYMGIHHGDLVFFLLEGKVSDTYIPIISFAILFTTIVVLGILLSKVIEKMLAFIQLKQLNKIGGIVFGVLKIFLFLLAGIYFFEKWDTKNSIISSEIKKESVMYPLLVKTSSFILPELSNNEILNITESLQQENVLNLED
ncbi:MAG: CvpA family protein [Bacteroidota bacterium]|nr:CvpA family protein [Bacteroidota bacterium]